VPRKKRRYFLTATAQRDFRQARQWSLARWGEDLTKQYFADLHEGAEQVAQNYRVYPEKGYLAGADQLGVHAVREHYIVYVPVAGKRIVIVALIRQTRDVPALIQANGCAIRRQLKEILDKLESGGIPNLR
jgi:plasmid stabilization system protein ParE